MQKLFLKAYDRVTKITKGLAILGAISIAILMIVNFTDIIGAKFFLISVPGALDISEELMVCLTLFPIAYITLERGHIRITLLEEIMPQSARFVFRIIQYVIAILITGFITSRVFNQFQETIKIMEMKKGIGLPIWPSNLVVTIAFGFLTFVWILLLAKSIIDGEKV